MRFQIHTGKGELREVKFLAKGKQLVRDSGIPQSDDISCQKPFQLPRILLTTVNIFWIYPKPQDFTFITKHIHSWVMLLLWLCLFILSGVISPLISIANQASIGLGSSSFSFLSFCLFTPFMEFSDKNTEVVFHFPSPVDQVLSELSTITHPS